MLVHHKQTQSRNRVTVQTLILHTSHQHGQICSRKEPLASICTQRYRDAAAMEAVPWHLQTLASNRQRVILRHELENPA